MFVVKPAELAGIAQALPDPAPGPAALGNSVHDPRASKQASDRRRDDLLLIFPPQWSPFQPYLSTPLLLAYLRRAGFFVRQYDWNIDYYEYFISSDRIAGARARLETYVSELPAIELTYRRHAVCALNDLARYDILHRRVQQLREPDTAHDLCRYREATEALSRLLSAFSAAEPVIELGAGSLFARDALTSWLTLRPYLDAEKLNPFVEFFRSKIAGLSAPGCFGISIIAYQQIVAGLTLARQLKTAFPDVPIVIGGSVFSRLVEKSTRLLPLFGEVFDYVCRYEGERPMQQFLYGGPGRSRETANLCFRRSNDLVLTDLCEPIPVSDLPVPDFDGLNLDAYFSPARILPLLASRGCYYGKCAFCYHGLVYQDRLRMRSAQQICEDVQTLNARHAAQHFSFVDEALPPKLFRSLPAVMPQNRFYFSGLYKFEKYFRAEDFVAMYAAGFRMFSIGLETASERLQAFMKKNNLQAVMIRNLRWAHEAGLWNHCFIFFGFPSETRDEARETIEFLLNHDDIIHSENTGTFSLEYGSPAYKEPEQFGIARIAASDEWLFELYDNYAFEGRGPVEAIEAAAEFARLKAERGAYQSVLGIWREHLLLLLAIHGRDGLRENCRQSVPSPLQRFDGEALRGPLDDVGRSGPRMTPRSVGPCCDDPGGSNGSQS
jgi:anaerobic magnesium-protoporphyrin IX monomethyl ester cyclase